LSRELCLKALPDKGSRCLHCWILDLTGKVRIDPCYYDKLTDQEEREVLIFDKIKQLIDNEEYPQKSMFNKADRSLEKAKVFA